MKRGQEVLGGSKLPPKDKAAMMRRKRAEYAEAGMSRAEFWLTPEQKERVIKYVEKVKK